MILHTVSTSPAGSSALRLCLRFCRSGDAVYFMDEAVYGLLTLRACDYEHLSLHACRKDLDARGMSLAALPEQVRVGDDDILVSLSSTADKVIHWG